MERKPAGTSKLEMHKAAPASSMWPFKSVYHSGIALYCYQCTRSYLYVRWTGSMQCASLDCQPHNSDHGSDQRLVAHIAEAMSACKPCCSPGSAPALPCSHVLTEQPLLESEIYFRKTFDDSPWWEHRCEILLKYLSALWLLKDFI